MSTEAHPSSDSASNHQQALRRDWTLFLVSTFLFSFGFAVYSGDFQNFLRDHLGANPLMLGGLESLREIPGLLAALMAGTLAMLPETRIASLGLLIMGIGIGFSGTISSYWLLVAITVFWSIGFHSYSPVSSSIALALAEGKEGGRHLSRMTAIRNAATVAALIVAWLVAVVSAQMGLRPIAGKTPSSVYLISFAFAGSCICLAGLLCIRISHRGSTKGSRARLLIRRKYSLYYLLSFLDGCRRQIFSIFASFALVLVYKVPLEKMLSIQFINAVLIILLAPLIGREIDKRGERGPLTFYSIGLIVVFLGYATIRTVNALVALFLIDNVLFSFGVGFTTYLNRIAEPNEITPCLSMGVTMNHIAAVTVPVGGAWLWTHYHNYQLPFWVGVVIATISLGATRWLPTEHKPQVPAIEEVVLREEPLLTEELEPEG
ncbi:Major Facilitator Superfamily transporter [Chthonomonas calidirosea]|uniref:MFS transporter n=1 Tax=Chthonomonas calidirosea TaxID=454171 RepID=UPI0006DD5128|nr:MFS transporter [Chthonomonas calidirosea]CEK15243.1 Major Facilitator Superfamily transporter [Chthonomonas calidirosea]